ncbi:hypothetical protein KO504_06520 [Winogradskyella psychrotolerans]|uniref:tetratricopeptide repeat protein n=1 Tax=Winogradskyella psychrotolerans TaxID=1344585 RepID=UPI001C0668FF|nr:hypothetical protein [Winogradskyella psychrotolerans]MBU2920990.1 hypothetical protein [Winogradskyella psychrotolerans]
MFSNALEKIMLLIVSFIICTSLNAQDKERIIKISDLDSLHREYYGLATEESYIVHNKLLKQSKKLSYDKGILSAYKSLVWQHGTSKRANLDSVLHYADLFETKIATKSIQEDTTLIRELQLPDYYLNKGQILANGFGLPEQGLESYFKVYPLIPKGNVRLSIAYNISISQIYYHKFQYDKALEVLTPLLKDTVGLGSFIKKRLLENISANYVQKEMPEKSYPLHKALLDLAIKDNKSYEIWWTKNKLANDYFRLGDVQRAIDSALVVRKNCLENNFHQLVFNNTAYLSTFYHAAGDLDKAIAYRKEAIQLASGAEYKKDTYNRLAEYYMEKKQYLNAIDVYKKKGALVDSLRANEKKALSSYIDSNIKLLKEKQKSQQMLFDMELLEIKNKKQELYYLSISAILVSIILLLGSILLFRKYKKGEKVIEVLKSNEKKLLEEKITLRENELEASAIALSRRIEMLTLIKNELDEIKKPQIPKLEEAKSKINNLIKSASDMSIITKRIESEYPTMSAKLLNKYPNLSDTQIRYCLLTKMNLSIKETATILNVTPNTVKVARSRLKKKLDIPPDISIKMFLDKLSKE